MNSRILTAFIAAVFVPVTVFTLDMEITGEIKTGIFAEQREVKGVTKSYASIHNNDGESGEEEGRIRLGINLEQEYFGMRIKFYKQEYKPADQFIKMVYAYAYGDLFGRRLKVSAGLLGESPWGTGGPEIQKDLETAGSNPILGIRTEWKPYFLPGLNLGFVLNRDNDNPPNDAIEQFGDIFLESVVGASYEHDYFALRFAYRFKRAVNSPMANVTGAQFVYRVEERILDRYVPGLHISANGHRTGIGAYGVGSMRGTLFYIQNWLYIQYDPELFEAGLNIGYKDTMEDNGQRLEFRPSFYWKFFDNFLSAGLAGGIEFGFNNDKLLDSVPWNFWFIEPQIKVNIRSDFYVAAVYRYNTGLYAGEESFTKDQKTNWFNLRLCYTF